MNSGPSHHRHRAGDRHDKANIENHIQTMRAKGRPVFRAVRENSEDAREWQTKRTAYFPTLIELANPT